MLQTNPKKKKNEENPFPNSITQLTEQPDTTDNSIISEHFTNMSIQDKWMQTLRGGSVYVFSSL